MIRTRYLYYVRHNVTSIDGFWETIYPLSTIALCGANLPSGEHLRVRFAGRSEECFVCLHTKRGEYIEEQNGLYRKGTFIFIGRDLHAVQEVWAILEVNLSRIDDMENAHITLSPIPIGYDRRPILPFSDERLEMILCVARIMMFFSNGKVTTAQLAEELSKRPNLGRMGDSDRMKLASFWLTETDRIGMTSRLDSESHEILISSFKEFKNIFGVNL